MRFQFILFISFLTFGLSRAQQDPFQIHLEPIHIDNLKGIQSYAVGQHGGLWLIIGGRIDGLHQRQPWATFNPNGRNTELTVVDPENHQLWTSSLTSLSLPLQDQLSSTNMEFYQDGDILYLIGGYGHSETINAKLTYAMITAIQVPAIIEAIQKGESIAPFITMQTDTRFAVAGGQLKKLYDTFYLVGGHNFEGDYNPMNHPTFTQTYTNAVRRFRIAANGTTMDIDHLPEWTDTAAFHRRDYNVGVQILPNGEEGLMSFSGPFQIDADLPYLTVSILDSQSYHQVPEFVQYYNNYHCPHIPLYSSSEEEMHTIFFGGIAQYYEDQGNLVQDNDVPFVKTITRVTRDQTQHLKEFKLPVEMPDFLGAGAEFIPLMTVPTYSNGVIKLDELSNEKIPVGYIYGGIRSSAENIFWSNDGTQSEAFNILYKVFISRDQSTALDQPNAQSNNGLQMQIFPNPNDGSFNINFFLKQKEDVLLIISDEVGQVILNEKLSDQITIGENFIEKNIKPFVINGIYFVTLRVGNCQATQKIIVKA